MRKLKRLAVWLLTVVMVIGMLPAAFAANISEYGERPFREGLKPALVDDKWNYINEQGEVVDLNRGRFMYVFDFFEGLAAVMDHDFMVGYIDKSGELVIACQFCSVSCMGMVYTGYFKNGVATVFDDSVNYDVLCERSYSVDMGGGKYYAYDYIGQIDKTGKLVKPFVAQELNAYTANLISDAGYMPGQEPAEPTTDYSFQITRVKPEFYSKDSNGDYILDTGASYGITFTNNTAAPLTREIAFVSYGKKLNEYAHLDAQIHYVSLNMAAHGTQAVNISSEFTRLSGGDYSFATVDFDDAADKRSFQSSVPMMQNSDRSIDNSTKGVQWLRDTLGVTVK